MSEFCKIIQYQQSPNKMRIKSYYTQDYSKLSRVQWNGWCPAHAGTSTGAGWRGGDGNLSAGPRVPVTSVPAAAVPVPVVSPRPPSPAPAPAVTLTTSTLAPVPSDTDTRTHRDTR